MTIKWSKIAVKQLTDILEYLEDNNQVKYSQQIEKEILSKIEKLPFRFKIYQLDRLKIKNDRSFYAFEIDNYRISFRALPQEIRILRIRHTSRRPFTK